MGVLDSVLKCLDFVFHSAMLFASPFHDVLNRCCQWFVLGVIDMYYENLMVGNQEPLIGFGFFFFSFRRQMVEKQKLETAEMPCQYIATMF